MPHTVAILSQYLYFSRCKVTVVCAHRQENKCFSAVCRLIFDLCQRIVCVHTNILSLLAVHDGAVWLSAWQPLRLCPPPLVCVV